MYTKDELLDLLRAQSYLSKFLFNIYVPPFASIILKALKDDDKIISCCAFCSFNKTSGFLFLLQDRLMFVHYPFAIKREELYINNVATFTKGTGLWNTIDITDAGGTKYHFFNLTEHCADSIVKYLNETKVK